MISLKQHRAFLLVAAFAAVLFLSDIWIYKEFVRAESYFALGVLVMIERQHVAIGDLPEQDWSLRVTQVYRRAGGGWEVVHRHADSLTNGISVEQAAVLARG